MTNPVDVERNDLLAELAATRATLLRAARDLTDEQAAQSPTVSALCVGGLVKHVTSMERSWLRFIVEGPAVLSFDLPEGVSWTDIMAGTAREIPQWMIDRDNEFRLLPGESLDGVLARYQEVATRTDELVANLPDLALSHALPPAPWQEAGTVRSARAVLMHVIAETAQHAGHAKLIRASIEAA